MNRSKLCFRRSHCLKVIVVVAAAVVAGGVDLAVVGVHGGVRATGVGKVWFKRRCPQVVGPT